MTLMNLTMSSQQQQQQQQQQQHHHLYHFNHHNKVATKGKKPYKSWLKDGVNGGPSSMEVLVRWLAYKPNYKKWRREDYSIDRVPKKDLLEEIIEDLRQVGIYHRLAKDVASKISTLQSNYRTIRKWKEIEEYRYLHQRGGEKALHDELLKRFPYWDALHPVFGFNSNSSSSSSSSNQNAMDIHHLVQSTASPLSAGSSNESITSDEDVCTEHNLERLVNNGRRREMKRMQKSRDMLYILRQKKHEKQQRHERLLLQHEKIQVERELISYLYKAGFTPNEALCYIK